MSAYVYDTETSSREEDREIIEAALIRLAPTKDLFDVATDEISLDVDSFFCERYKPERPLSCGSIAVHHILPHELESCYPSSTFKLPDDAEYVIGHSVDFDWEAAGSPANVKRICTFAMSEHLWPDAEGRSQVALIYMLFGARDETRAMVRDAHGAAVDVRLNMLLLREILKLKPEIRTWSALHAYSEECRIPLFCPLKRWDGVRLSEMDDSSIYWCLRQEWLDPYFRKGLERVMLERYPPRDGGRPWEEDDAPY